MTIAGTNLAHGTNPGADTWTTPSVSPTLNALQILCIKSTNGGVGSQTPSVTGLGLAWVVEKTGTVFAFGPEYRLTIVRALGNPTPGVLTITFGGVSNQGVYSWDQILGVATIGTSGSGAFVQSVIASSADLDPVVTFPNAFSDPANATFGCNSTHQAHNVASAPAGYSELSAEECTGVICLQTQMRNPGVNPITWASNNPALVNWRTTYGAELAVGSATFINPIPGASGGTAGFLRIPHYRPRRK